MCSTRCRQRTKLGLGVNLMGFPLVVGREIIDLALFRGLVRNICLALMVELKNSQLPGGSSRCMSTPLYWSQGETSCQNAPLAKGHFPGEGKAAPSQSRREPKHTHHGACGDQLHRRHIEHRRDTRYNHQTKRSDEAVSASRSALKIQSQRQY